MVRRRSRFDFDPDAEEPAIGRLSDRCLADRTLFRRRSSTARRRSANCGSSTSDRLPGHQIVGVLPPERAHGHAVGFAPGCIRTTTGAVWPGGVATVTCDDRPPIVQKPCGSGIELLVVKVQRRGPDSSPAASTTGTSGRAPASTTAVGVIVIASIARSSSTGPRRPTKLASTGNHSVVCQRSRGCGCSVHVWSGGPLRPICSDSGSGAIGRAIVELHRDVVGAGRQREAAVVNHAHRLRIRSLQRLHAEHELRQRIDRGALAQRVVDDRRGPRPRIEAVERGEPRPRAEIDRCASRRGLPAATAP